MLNQHTLRLANHSFLRRLLVLVAVLCLGTTWLHAAEPSSSSPGASSLSPIVHLTPVSHAYPGDTLTISAEVGETKESAQEYQFLWDGAVLQDWSPASSCQRLLSEKDIGLHRVTVHVRAPDGQGSQDTELYVYRRPPNPFDHDPSVD